MDDKLWKAFSEYIRRRNADENGMVKCFTCSSFKHWKEMQAGHGIPRQHWGTRYDEKNVQSQCRKCNCFEQGEQAEFSKQVDLKYGAGTWGLLIIKKHLVRKRPSKFEIDALTKFYKQKILDL
jgi:hypothetical protein